MRERDRSLSVMQRYIKVFINMEVRLGLGNNEGQPPPVFFIIINIIPAA